MGASSESSPMGARRGGVASLELLACAPASGPGSLVPPEQPVPDEPFQAVPQTQSDLTGHCAVVGFLITDLVKQIPDLDKLLLLDDFEQALAHQGERFPPQQGDLQPVHQDVITVPLKERVEVHNRQQVAGKSKLVQQAAHKR